MPHEPLSLEDRKREKHMLKELHKFYQHNCTDGQPMASTMMRKRTRIPRVEIEANPFCLERQLADEYQLQNFNENPKFYQTAINKESRMERNPRNYSSFRNDVNAVRSSEATSHKANMEFAVSAPAIEYSPMKYKNPLLIEVNPVNATRETRTSAPKSLIQTPDYYILSSPYTVQTASMTAATFGHRPQSGVRMYNPLTGSILAAQKSKVLIPTPSKHSKSGMNAAHLQQLLTPSQQKASVQEHLCSRSKQELTKNKEKQRKLRELEANYHSGIYSSAQHRKEPRSHPPEQSTKDLINKYRKLAVGKTPEATQD